MLKIAKKYIEFFLTQLCKTIPPKKVNELSLFVCWQRTSIISHHYLLVNTAPNSILPTFQNSIILSFGNLLILFPERFKYSISHALSQIFLKSLFESFLKSQRSRWTHLQELDGSVSFQFSCVISVLVSGGNSYSFRWEYI